jgi:hypothetical protein
LPTIDLGLERHADRVDEIATVLRRLESDDAATEEPLEELASPWAHAEAARTRPRSVPERDDRAERQPASNQVRRQREVIVLHQDEWELGVDLLAHRRGESRVHRLVHLEVVGPEDRLDARSMAQRPQPLVGEPIVIAAFLIIIQPDAPKPVVTRGL